MSFRLEPKIDSTFMILLTMLVFFVGTTISYSFASQDFSQISNSGIYFGNLITTMNPCHLSLQVAAHNV